MNKIYFKSALSYDDGIIYSALKEILSFYKMEERINSDVKILIKPNMLSASAPEKAVTTHPAVVDNLIVLLKEMGATAENITVADSGGGVSNSRVQVAAYRARGFADVAKKHGVNLYVKLESTVVKTDGQIAKEFEVIRPAAESDIIINLPKFKTHVMTGMSRAVKNMFGVIPGLKKAEMHMRFPQKENFAKMLVDLSQAVKPTLTIVDGVMAMEGDGPGGGIPRQLGLLIAGENSHFIDLVIAGMMGFAPSNLPLIQEAMSRGFIPREMPRELIRGDMHLYKKIENWVMPRSYSVDFSHRVPRPIRWATPTVEKILAPKPKIVKNKCIGCGRCREICPQHTIKIENRKAVINMKNCIKCFCCHEMCPAKAIDVKRNIFFNI